MTEDLRIEFERFARSTYSETPILLKKWAELTGDEAMDFKAQVTMLVMETDLAIERCVNGPRFTIRRPLSGIMKLAAFKPWSELIVVNEAGGVSLNESITNKEVRELWNMLAPYQYAIGTPAD